MAKKYVYYFGDGKAEGTGSMKELLGGKGAGLTEMTNLKVSVPPGFTISTEACVEYYKRGKAYPPGMMDEALHALKRIERSMKAGFGDPDNPLLVSVRSVHGLALKTKNERFAQDSYRRFIGMFGSIVMGVNREHFEDILKHKKRDLGVTQDTHLDAKALKELVVSFKELVKEETKRDFPDDPLEQLRMAINAVFSSWYGARAVTYRRLYNIPATGQRQFFGECLTNAQGEDVVAGIRTPLPVKELEKFMPEAYKDLEATYKKLERHYRDMLDLEFTIQEGKLYMLQTRVGKRTGVAAVRVAVDMVKEGLITKKEALQRIGPDQLAQYLYPIFDAQEESRCTPLGKGLPAGPGAAAGKLALTADRAVEMKAAGNRVVLVRQETSPDDIHGMNAALGFLTARGGMTSHAAVVARQMGKVCVAGCEAIEVLDSQSVRIGTQVFREGEYLSVNGSTGNVYGGDIPVVESEVIQVLQGKMEASASEKYQLFESVLKWADGVRKLKVRANADVPDQARIARSFGAEGIGLCRTEHMFFAEDRIQIMQKMILARKREEREMYLDQLLPLQKQDFIGLYREMKGFPVTIRLLDPPLHEFLPKREDLMVEIAQLELTSGAPTVLEEKKRLLARVEELHEFNPMLGLRGCRLGITMPEITKMQARAIIEAA